MKKIISIREIILILISMVIITMSTSVLGTGLVLGDENDTNASIINKNEYENAQNVQIENITNNNTNNNINNNNNNINNVVNNNSANKAKTYNTNNTTDLPQTGIEDYNVGILLVICVASAIYAYKKINDYKNI